MEDFAIDTPYVDAVTPHAARQPLQGRSRASFERMVGAARALMIERGSDDFTLNEVSRKGGVSIGSIYCRFESKDDLIRAVQALFTTELDAAQDATVDAAVARSTGLRVLVPAMVDGIAELFRDVAPMLCPLMLRANTDPVVAAIGKNSFHRLEDRVVREFLVHRDEIRHAQPERAARSSFRVAYAMLARYLGFASSAIAAHEGDWSHLKEDLGMMCTAFLMTPPPDQAPAVAQGSRTRGRPKRN